MFKLVLFNRGNWVSSEYQAVCTRVGCGMVGGWGGLFSNP